MFFIRLSEVLEVRQSHWLNALAFCPCCLVFIFWCCRFSVCFDFHISFRTRWVNVFVSFSLFVVVLHVKIRLDLVEQYLYAAFQLLPLRIVLVLDVCVAFIFIWFLSPSHLFVVGDIFLRASLLSVPLKWFLTMLLLFYSFFLFLHKRNDPLWLRNCVYFFFSPAAIQPAHCTLREYLRKSTSA